MNTILDFIDDLSDYLDFQGVGALFALLPVIALTIAGALGAFK